MINICYLAAGNSLRFGENKLLYPFHGKLLYQHGLTILVKICKQQKDCRCFVISRYQRILDDAESHGASVVLSPQSALGMSHTIRSAIHSMENLVPQDRILFVCADQPFLSEATMLKLIQASSQLADHREDDSPVAACASWENIMGNPVLFSSFLSDELCSLQGDCGGKTVLKHYANRIIRIPCLSASELLDIDEKDPLIRKEGKP